MSMNDFSEEQLAEVWLALVDRRHKLTQEQKMPPEWVGGLTAKQRHSYEMSQINSLNRIGDIIAVVEADIERKAS